MYSWFWMQFDIEQKQRKRLTWPKKRKGKRKVRPLHIQDWNPSAETQKNFINDLGTPWHTIQHKWSLLLRCLIRGGVRSKSTEAFLKLRTAVQHQTNVNTCPHLSTLPYFSRHCVADGSRVQAIKMTTTENSLPTVRSSWFLSPKARSRYKQPLW